jgi:2'-5' RNA ligase
LFFALWPDDDLRHAIGHVAASLPAPRGARLVRADRLHLTVVFLGDFDPLTPPMLSVIEAAAASVRAPCFELSLDHVGQFTGSRVGWLGPRTVPVALTALHDALSSALHAAGVPLKSSAPFVPHVTIQRNVRTPLPAADLSALPWTVSDFVLVQSVPGSPEPYRIVGTWPLATG